MRQKVHFVSDVAARGKIDAGLARGRDIVLDGMQIEQVAAIVQLDTLLELRQMPRAIGFRGAQGGGIVNDDALRAGLHMVAQGS